MAGLAAAVLSAVRLNGILFAIFAGARLVRERGAGTLEIIDRPERLLPIVFAPAGMMAFFWFSYLTTGDAFASITSQYEGWGRTIDWPWFNIFVYLAHGGALARYWIGSSLLFFIASLLLLKYRYFDEFWFCLFSFIFFWSAASIPHSMMRLVSTLFPVYLGLARFVEGRPRAAGAVIAMLAIWNAMLMSAWTAPFT
jgi:hypothetical protein